MKKLIIPGLILLTASFITGCNKWAEEKANISQYIIPPGVAVSDAAPISGPVKGIMLAGKTYTLGGDIYINKGDTLIIQPGVTINATNQAGIIVRGVLASLGTPTQPILMTVPGMVKNTTPGSSDSAHSGGWKGIIGDVTCPLMVIKWTRMNFAGANYGSTVGPSVNQSSGTSYNILFQNPNGYFIIEDSWIYGGTDDCIRVSAGKIHVFRNTFENTGGSGGDCVNVKGGTIGTMAYNFFMATAYNGQKASNKGIGVGSPQTNIVMYNSTFVNCGRGVVPGQRGSTIDFEQQAAGAYYNNVAVNCRVGYRVVNGPAADTLHLTYGYNYQWGDNSDIASNFFTFGPVSTNPQPTDLPDPSSYLPANYIVGTPYDGSNAVQKLNPLFVNYPLPVPGGTSPWTITAVGSYNFHLQPGSPLIGKAYNGIRPMVVVPVDPTFGASEVTPAGNDLGCYQFNGKGNQH